MHSHRTNHQINLKNINKGKRMKKILFGAVASLLALNANAALINIYESDSTISSIAQSNAVIGNAGSATTSTESDTIFFSDVGHHGAPSFPNNHTETFVLTATGMLDTSLYSALSFYHDDGIIASLAGEELYVFNKNTGLKDSGWHTFSDTGMESFDLLFWENGGAASVLVYGLLRDGGTSEVAQIASSVPAPATSALLGLGLISLMVARRRKV